MKKRMMSLALVLLMAVSLGGCAGTKDATRKMNTLSTLYRTKMDKGQTTPDQDKDFIRAVNNLALQVDRAVRGTKSADQTRQDAEIMGQTGIDPNAPIVLPPSTPQPPAASPNP